MADHLIHFVMLIAGGYLVWFIKPLRRDSISQGLGFATGVTLSYAINQSSMYLIAVPFLALLLVWRFIRQKPSRW